MFDFELIFATYESPEGVYLTEIGNVVGVIGNQTKSEKKKNKVRIG
jgi:hypothetical protein